MLIEILISIGLGILAGTFTGLTPGIHINLIGAFIVSISTTIAYKIPPLFLVIFITSMSITHTFLDFIPSILLGCPDTETELSILPGHNLLKKGEAYEAIILTAKGSLSATIIFILIAFPSIKILQKIHPVIQEIIPWLLISISLFMVLTEKNKTSALKIFILTGILGYLSYQIHPEKSLLPLLTGLFGTSLLIQSIKNKTLIPPQKITFTKIKKFRAFLGATIAAPLCSFLPGLGAGQAAIIGSSLLRQSQKEFLILLGATNTLVMEFSFLALYALSRTRTGSTVAVKELLLMTPRIFLILIFVMAISSLISYFLTKKLSLISIKQIHKINYSKLSKGILFFLAGITLVFSGVKGFAILLASTLLGIYSLRTPVRKTNMMGSLVIPTIIWYLF